MAILKVRRWRPVKAVAAVWLGVLFLVFLILPPAWTWERLGVVVLNGWGAWVLGRAALSSVTVKPDEVVIWNSWRTHRVPISEVRAFMFQPCNRVRALEEEPVLVRVDGAKVQLDGLLSLVLVREAWIRQQVVALNAAIDVARAEGPRSR